MLNLFIHRISFRSAMKNGNVPYVEAEDEAAFYGPKVDVQVWSVIGKEFSLATNQVDFAVPERFDLKFTNKEGNDEVPLCIHPRLCQRMSA